MEGSRIKILKICSVHPICMAMAMDERLLPNWQSKDNLLFYTPKKDSLMKNLTLVVTQQHFFLQALLSKSRCHKNKHNENYISGNSEWRNNNPSWTFLIHNERESFFFLKKSWK